MARVSVVLIFLDAERFIAEAVASVCAQTFEDWELILVDDGSRDASSALAQGYAEADKRIRYFDHEGHANQGMSASRNLGASQASGEYLAFLDADDVWEKAKLEEQVALLDRDPEVALVCGAFLYWHSWHPAAEKQDKVVLTAGIADRRLDPPEAALLPYPLGKEAGAGLDGLARRTAFEAVGGFEKVFRGLYEDQVFLMKIFLDYPIYISGRAWLRYRQHDASSCALASRSPAEYRQLRSNFLDWLDDYLRDRPAVPEVRRALARARHELRVSAFRAGVRSWLGQLRRVSRAASKAALPAASLGEAAESENEGGPDATESER